MKKMYNSIDEMRVANRRAGQHWFDEQAMRFFDSRIETPVLHGTYFISSEQYHRLPCDGRGCRMIGCQPRKYTIRQMVDACVEEIGSFQQYETLDEARSALEKIIWSYSPAS